MYIEEKLARSQYVPDIDLGSIGCRDLAEPLVLVPGNAHLRVEPIWEVGQDQEAPLFAQYVADPSLKLPPHCCGAAVDVDVIENETGSYLDFGTKMNQDNERSHLHSPDITDEQRENRLSLLRPMPTSGFASNSIEWWHYSYGDQTWAWFYNQSSSLYSVI